MDELSTDELLDQLKLIEMKVGNLLLEGRYAEWTVASYNLGTQLAAIHTEKRGAESQSAIEHLENAKLAFEDKSEGDYSKIFSLEDKYWLYANLANVYAERGAGDHVENIELAFKYQKHALSFLDPVDDVDLWASGMKNLALTYGEMRYGNEADNIEYAIATLEEGLSFVTPVDSPLARSDLIENLADLYAKRLRGSQTTNISEAKQLYERAQQLIAEGQLPQDKVEAERVVNRVIRLSQKIIALPNFKNQNKDESATDGDSEDSSTRNQKQQDVIDKFYEFSERQIEQKHPMSALRAVLSYLDIGFSIGFLFEQSSKTTLLGAAYKESNRALNLIVSLMKMFDLDHAPAAYMISTEKLAQLSQLMMRFAILDDLGAHRLNKHYNSEVPSLSSDAADFLDVTKTHYLHCVSLVGKNYFQRTLVGFLGEIGELCVISKEWDYANVVFRRISKEIESTILALDTSEEERYQEKERLYSMLSYGGFSLGGTGNVLEALKFVSLTQSTLLLKQFDIRNSGLDDERETEILSLQFEQRSLEARLLEPSLFARRRVLDRIVEIRTRLSELSKTLKLSNYDFELFLSKTIGSNSCLLLPIITPYGGVLLTAQKIDGKLNLDTINIEDSFEFMKLFEDGGWNSKYAKYRQHINEESFFETINATRDELKKKLFASVVRKLQNYRKIDEIIIVPTGSLGLLPLNVVSDEKNEYLIDNYSIRLIPNLLMAKSKENRRSNTPLKTLKIGACPKELAETDLFQYVEHESAILSSNSHLTPSFVNVNAGANGKELLHQMVGNDIWYFPTHSYFDENNPDNSYIQISENQIITLSDISNLTAQQTPRLAILSACETGLFKSLKNTGEFIGWPHAFMHLGVEGVIATLWPVSTFPTTFLIGKLSDYLSEGNTVPHALRMAQLWFKSASVNDLIAQVKTWTQQNSLNDSLAETLLHDLRKLDIHLDSPAFPEPNFWAAFVYYGSNDLKIC